MTDKTLEGGAWTLFVDGNDLPSAEELRDRASIAQDLKLVVECVKRLLVELPDDDQTPRDRDNVVVQTLSTTALIAYARCFNGGVRIRLSPQDVVNLGFDGDVAGFHQHLIDLRSKHVAHSVNAFEKVSVGISISAGEPLRADGVAVLQMRHIAFDREGLQAFGRIASALLKVTNAEGQRLQDAALAEAQHLDPDNLRGRRELTLAAPGPEQAGTRRPRQS